MRNFFKLVVFGLVAATLVACQSSGIEEKSMEHLRIYDRILENCVPVRVTGKKRRQEMAEKKIRAAKELLTDTSKSAV